MPETKTLRVLHIITRMILGGAQENTLLTVEGLDRMPEYDAELCSGVDNGPEGELLTRAAKTTRLTVVPEMARAVNPISDLAAFWKLYRLIRKGKYHIVHTHSWKAGFLGRIAAWMAGTPLIVHTFHGLTFHDHQPWLVNRAIRWSEKICAPLTHHYVSVSDVTTAKALAANIDRAEKFTTVYSGMELDWYLNSVADPQAIRRELGIPAEAPVVGKIARLAPQKNHDELLKAAPEIVRRHPDVRFLLVGNGVLYDKILEQVRQLGFEKNFVFAGLIDRERIPDMISAMDVVAHTALWEGLPRVLPQAMAMGKPCVSFDTDGTPEVLISGKTGYMINRHDSAGLADAVSNLLSDPALRRQIGEAARKHVDPAFRAETMVCKTAEIYKMLAGRYEKRIGRFDRRYLSEPSHEAPKSASSGLLADRS
ncbi:MAG: glycosyltransferase family 4 protein [Pyrinomonadaceae bacterium]